MDKVDNTAIDKGKLPKLTRKQRAFVRELKKDPTISPTRVAMKVYDVSSENSASVIASQNLRKKAIVSHLDAYNDIVESTLSNTILEYSDSKDIKERTLAVETSKWVHDKLHGKSISRNINVNASVDIESIIDNLI